MTKEDKLFFTGLIKGLERRLDGHDKYFVSHGKRFAQIDRHLVRADKHMVQMDKRMAKADKCFAQVDKRFDRLEEKVEGNSRGIRYNGMLIEQMRDDITLIKERDSIFDEMNAKLDSILESIGVDIPALKQAVMNHGDRIIVLEAKCG